jgi:copper homeostasis protein
VLIGSGVKASAIRAFREKYPQAVAFHMSGKMEVPSGMIFRREGIPMGIPGLDEWHISQTGQKNVRAARQALDE